MSNDIYLGAAHILTIPLPAWVLELASIFRSDGRFFWPVMYMMTAIAIAAAIPVFGSRGVLLLVVAGSLQWINSTPARQAFADSIHTPEAPRIDLATWKAAIARHDSLRVLPQYLCLPDRQIEAEIAIHLQLLAAIANRPINSVYASRFKPDCAADQRVDPMPRPDARQLSVFFKGFARFADMRALAEADRPMPGR